jgi:glycolate oxidase FAD binding subunit
MSASGFESIVGAAHVEAVEAASLDAVPVQALVRPADAEQLAACLAHARERGLAVVPTGGGSKLDGANPLDAERCVRLDLRRLDRLDLDPDEGIASVGAGACLADLQAAARERGKRVLFPGARPGATLGGTFSSDEVDPDASPDRHPAYEVLGATAALADGTLARAGGSVVKNVTGFDLVRLYAGAFGTLVVVTELVVRLRPLPERALVHRLDAPDLAAAIAAAHERRLRGPGPEALAIRPVGAGAGAALLTRLEGAVDDVERRAADGGSETAPEADWEDLRRVAAGPGDAACRVRLGARPSDLRELAESVASAAGADALVLLLPLVGSVLADVPESSAEWLLEVARENGWVCRLGRAPLAVRHHIDAFGPPPATLPLMRELKRRFDPERMLSPGRFVAGI